MDNIKALEVIPKLTPEILEKIEEILSNKPKPIVSHVSADYGVTEAHFFMQATFGRYPLQGHLPRA